MLMFFVTRRKKRRKKKKQLYYRKTGFKRCYHSALRLVKRFIS
jgi:hypothetical protein